MPPVGWFSSEHSHKKSPTLWYTTNTNIINYTSMVTLQLDMNAQPTWSRIHWNQHFIILLFSTSLHRLPHSGPCTPHAPTDISQRVLPVGWHRKMSGNVGSSSYCHTRTTDERREWRSLWTPFFFIILPTPTAEWSASLEQLCRKVMVTPLLLLSSEDNLMKARDAHFCAPWSTRNPLVVSDSGSALVKLSSIFPIPLIQLTSVYGILLYLEILVRSISSFENITPATSLVLQQYRLFSRY
jgi:hypothetical protein